MRRRIPFGALAPISLFVAAAITWSVAWYLKVAAVEDGLAAWRADLAARGTALACAEESIGGYPFRFEFNCDRAEVTIGVGDGSYRLAAAAVRAVALVYDLENAIVEIDAPVILASAAPGARTIARAGAGTLRSSFEIVAGHLSRLSLVAPSLELAPVAADPSAVITASDSELHVRARPDADAVDIAVKTGPASYVLPAGRGRIEVASTNVVAIVNHPPETRLVTLDTWLERWRAAGGVADVTRLTFDAPELGGDGAGVVSLSDSGHLEGALNARLTKLDAFTDSLEANGVIDDGAATILRAAVGALGAGPGGGPAVALPVRIRDGAIHIGPVKVATLPPLI